MRTSTREEDRRTYIKRDEYTARFAMKLRFSDSYEEAAMDFVISLLLITSKIAERCMSASISLQHQGVRE
jgi:hypothetical protein